MSTIKNVTLVGAAGSLGSVVLAKLQASNLFNIQVLRRTGSSSTYSPDVKVLDADFSSVESLTNALKSQDAVVAALGATGVEAQFTLIDASIAAGVKRFIPSEFGSNLENNLVRKLPVFAQKVKVADYLQEKAKTTSLTYTFVYNSAFLDWGLKNNFIFDLSPGAVQSLYDGGDTVFSATNLATVGDGVVGILTHPDETKNRVVCIEDTKLTQKKLLEFAKKAAPGQPWESKVVSLDDIHAHADKRLAEGLYDMQTFAPYILRSLFDPKYSSAHQKTDNELLGIKGLSEDQVVELIRSLL